ncbi:MAG: hypothetical protein JW798_06120, partial [Prolixibacteraceae bacterium]|nr:hypothetical protein [Prolixibacteraceae bacterium]
NAPPGGYRIGSGTFYSERAVGDFWSASEYDTDNANFKYLNYNRTDLISTNYSKKYGLSVRCMRD